MNNSITKHGTPRVKRGIGYLFKAGTFVLAASLLITTAGAVGAGPGVYKDARQIADNLKYIDTISYSADAGRQESYTLKLTGKGDAYPIFMPCDTIYGRMTIDDMIAYAKSQGKNVLAAVNSDFFSMANGVPMGIAVENGEYKSSPEGRNAVAFNSDGSVYFSQAPDVTMTLTNNGGDTDKTDSGKTLAVSHFNKYRADTGGMYLFSSAFSTVSTRTSTPGYFVRFKILDGSRPSIGGTMSLQVEEMFEYGADIPIGDDSLVLTAADACGMCDQLSGSFKVGDKVTLKTTCSDEKLTGAKWASGSGDILIKNGAETDSAGWDRDLLNAYPRTAFGVKADGTVVSYVMDGRETGHSSGLTLKNLADELLAQGCVDAVNFDGGGSSAMSIRIPGLTNAAVVNDPSDGSERKCGAYLLYVTDQKSDGRAKFLSLNDEGAVIMTGASVSLSYTAVDSGYMPVTAPGDVTASSASLGSVQDGVYTAGGSTGTDTLTLASPSTGIGGNASLFLITTPTDIAVTAEGVTGWVNSLTMWAGDKLQLSASASYYGRSVITGKGSFTYTVAGSIGTYDVSSSVGIVNDAGILAAGTGAQPGQSFIVTVSAGDKKIDIPVAISGFADTGGHWAKDYIKQLYFKGVVNGTSDTLFSPEATLKRGDFILMLYRAAGKPSAGAASTFEDVKSDDYYADAIAWAQGAGIAQGTGGKLFNPTATLTREQAFTLVYRALGAYSLTAPSAGTEALAAFTDTKTVSDYALTPTETLVKMGIVGGSGGLLTPKAEMTRAQMAKILCSVIQYNASKNQATPTQG